MATRETVDFTSGSIPKHLIKFSIPLFLGNLLQALYNTVDSIWVGKFLGANALAAVTVGGPVIFALVAMVTGLTMATTTLVAQYYGAREHTKMRVVIGNSLVLLTVLGIIITIVGVVFNPTFLKWINVPEEIFDDAVAYLSIFFSGMVANFLYNVVSAILRGLGDSRTPLRFMAIASITNIILDPVFIFGLGPIPRLEVAGAAWATVISQIVSAILSLHYLFEKSHLVRWDRSIFKLNWQLIRQMLRIGLPAGAQQTLVSLSSLAVNSIVNRFGPTVVAGFGAAMRVDQFGFMPAMSVSLAVSSMVGQNLGARKRERVRDVVRSSMILSGSIALVVSLACLTIPEIFLRVFTSDTGVLIEGSRYLRTMAFAFIPMAWMFTLTGVLRGAGDTVASMFISLGSLWLVRVPLTSYLAFRRGMGPQGVWLGIAISIYMGCLFNYLYYRTGRWVRAAVTSQTQQSEDLGEGIA